MDDLFKIYIDRLKSGEEEILAETFSPEFMEISESDLQFNHPIKLSGKATLANDTLLIRFSITTEAMMRCAICNDAAKVKIDINNFCHTENLEDIKGSVYNFKEILREAILLELPMTVECHEGNCPERASMAKYMKKNKESEKKDNFFHPFADI